VASVSYSALTLWTTWAG